MKPLINIGLLLLCLLLARETNAQALADSIRATADTLRIEDGRALGFNRASETQLLKVRAIRERLQEMLMRLNVQTDTVYADTLFRHIFVEDTVRVDSLTRRTVDLEGRLGLAEAQREMARATLDSLWIAHTSLENEYALTSQQVTFLEDYIIELEDSLAALPDTVVRWDTLEVVRWDTVYAPSDTVYVPSDSLQEYYPRWTPIPDRSEMELVESVHPTDSTGFDVYALDGDTLTHFIASDNWYAKHGDYVTYVFHQDTVSVWRPYWDLTLLDDFHGSGTNHHLDILTLASIERSLRQQAEDHEPEPEPDGTITIEAEDFDANTPFQVWQWATRDSFIVVLPDRGHSHWWEYRGARVDYALPEGTYYAWVRMRGIEGGSSILIGTDGEILVRSTHVQAPTSGEWVWVGELSDGQRITVQGDMLNIWMREDGAAVDKLVLTKDPNWRP